jgi:hypothetical protein
VKLREFKARSLARLVELRKELLSKYPDKAERIRYIADVIATKLENLRTFTLTDYIATLYHASKEFAEFEQLIPSSKEVEELLRSGE